MQPLIWATSVLQGESCWRDRKSRRNQQEAEKSADRVPPPPAPRRPPSPSAKSALPPIEMTVHHEISWHPTRTIRAPPSEYCIDEITKGAIIDIQCNKYWEILNLIWALIHEVDRRKPDMLPNNGPRELTVSWRGCYGSCYRYKPTKLAHSFLFCSCLCFCLCPFQLCFIP